MICTKSQTRVSLFHLPMNYPRYIVTCTALFYIRVATVQAVLQEVKDAEGRVVLFIDEAWESNLEMADSLSSA